MEGLKTKSAVVLVNLGTPEELTVPAVRAFLKQFLSDHRVVEIPKPIWWLILNLIILNIRPAKIIENYKKVWMTEGSPLRVITEWQAEKLQKSFDKELGENAPKVVYAMTYGKPAIADTIDKLYSEGSRRIVVLPMYPQYSGSTTGAVYDQVADYLSLIHI